MLNEKYLLIKPYIFSDGINAYLVAFFFGVKIVSVSACAAIPEPGAASILHVKSPSDHKVPLWSPVLLQPADIRGRHRQVLVLAPIKVISLSCGVAIRAAAKQAGCTATAFEVNSRGWCSSVGTTSVLPVFAGAALLTRAPGNGDTIGAAAILVSVTGAALHVWPGGGGELVRAATILCGHTAASLKVWAPGSGRVVRAAAELCVLAAATLGVRSLGWGDVVRAAAKLSVEAAALLVGAVGWVHQVITAAPLGIFAGSRIVTALEVETLGPGHTIRAAAILCEGAVLVDLPILVGAALKLGASSRILEGRTAAKLCLFTRVAEEHFIWTSEAALLLGSL